MASPASVPLPGWLADQAARIGRDDITGLPDRRSFGLALTVAETLVRQAAWPGYAVLALDLDRFKAVNDRLGHAAGDALLRAAAGRIAAGLRGGDLAARTGGDEFAVLLTPPAAGDAPAAIAARLIALLGQPFTLGGQTALIGASAGIAQSDAKERHGAALLRRADLALVQAKADGRGRCRVFDAGMQARMAAQRALEQDLRQALARGELRLAYRPRLDAAAVLQGHEALLHWDRPGHGVLLPADFLPAAEEAGLAGAIGAWMLATACRTATQWRDGFLRVVTRVAPAQLAGGDLVGDVTQALQASGLPPGRLELDIAETALLRDAELALPQLQALRGMGVHVSLCDFGAKHGSLTLLRAFPFSRVTIDDRLARMLATDPAGTALLHALSLMGGVPATGIREENGIG